LLPKIANVIFHILKNNVLSYNLILGRDFLTDNTYTPLGEDLENRIQLFSEIATINVINTTLNETTNVLNDITIDFDSNIEQQLISVFEVLDRCTRDSYRRLPVASLFPGELLSTDIHYLVDT